MCLEFVATGAGCGYCTLDINMQEGCTVVLGEDTDGRCKAFH